MCCDSTSLAGSYARLSLRQDVTEYDAVMAIYLYEESITSRSGQWHLFLNFLTFLPLQFGRIMTCQLLRSSAISVVISFLDISSFARSRNLKFDHLLLFFVNIHRSVFFIQHSFIRFYGCLQIYI